MLLNFYVQASSKKKLDSGYFDRAKSWILGLDMMSFDESVAWSIDQAFTFWDKGKRAFRYLSGAPLPPLPLSTPPRSSPEEDSKRNESSTGVWSFTALFSGLRGRRSEAVVGSRNPKQPDGSVWTDGEVHADLVRVHIFLPALTCIYLTQDAE
jgi:import inner membrane translocase subunit TIM21